MNSHESALWQPPATARPGKLEDSRAIREPQLPAPGQENASTPGSTSEELTNLLLLVATERKQLAIRH